MFRKKVVIFLIILFTLIGLFYNNSYATEVNIKENDTVKTRHNPEPIQVPETNINLKIDNLTIGCEVYLLLSENLLRYNLEKFINNNIDNPYQIQADEAKKLKEFLDNSDYVGYVNYFNEAGFEVEDNEIELRHYCFCLGESEVVGMLEYNGANYVQIKINLNENDEFKLIFKDYLTNYNTSDTKFMIDEYGSITYIDLTNQGYTTNSEKTNITECNIIHNFVSNEDFTSIERATNLAYLILYIFLLIVMLIILISLIKRHIRKKKEIEDRKFWKKKLTKEEKKEEKKKQKELKKEKKNKKKKK